MIRQIVAATLMGAMLVVTNAPVANAFSGRHLISAVGAVHETVAAESGTISLSGLIDFNKSNGASAVDVTIDLVDSGGDSIACVLSTPSDVTYSLSKGMGTLTLTVGSSDVCTTGNTGKTIVFNFVVLSNTGRITATSINLVDDMSDVVDLTTATGSILTQ
jgi:hypothetical protein